MPFTQLKVMFSNCLFYMTNKPQGIFTMVLSRFLLDKRVQLLIEDQKCEKKSSLDSMSIPCIYKPGPLQPLWSVLSNLYVFFCHPTVNTFCARTPAVSRQKSSHVTQHAKMDTFLNHANRCQQRLQRTSNRFVFMGSLWNVYYNCFMFGDTDLNITEGSAGGHCNPSTPRFLLSEAHLYNTILTIILILLSEHSYLKVCFKLQAQWTIIYLLYPNLDSILKKWQKFYTT